MASHNKDPPPPSATMATTVPSTPRLNGLPPEVTELIAEQLAIGKLMKIEDPAGYACGFESSSAAEDRSLEDFSSLRLTCKDLDLKTFHAFGRTFFSTIPVVFEHARLQWLQNIAQHKNTFGLSLATFPTTIAVSVYRLLSTYDEFQYTGYILCGDSGDEAKATIEGILLAAKIGFDGPRLNSPYNSRIQANVDRYRKAVKRQRVLDASGNDVRILTHSLAAFPRLKGLERASRHGWDPDEWRSIAGIRKEAFTDTTLRALDPDDISTSSRVMNKVLSAINGANTLRQPHGHPLSLEWVDFGSDDDTYLNMNSYGPIRLHHLATLATGVSLKPVFSRLKGVRLSLKTTVRSGDMEDVMGKVVAALHVLLSGDKLETLDLVCDAYPDYEDVAICERLLGLFTHMHSGDRLRKLHVDIENLRPTSIQPLIKKHAATLEALKITSLTDSDSDTPEARRKWKSVLTAAVSCPKLSLVELSIRHWVNTHVHFKVKGKKEVSTVLQYLIDCPTDAGKDSTWICYLQFYHPALAGFEGDSGAEDE